MCPKNRAVTNIHTARVASITRHQEQENPVRHFAYVSKVAAVTAIAVAAISIPVASAGAATPTRLSAPAVAAQPVTLSASLPGGNAAKPDFLGGLAEAVVSAVAGGVAGGVAGAYAAAQFAAPAAEVAAEVSSSSSSSSSGNAFNYNTNRSTDSRDIQFDVVTN